jgi:hypothetical protein
VHAKPHYRPREASDVGAFVAADEHVHEAVLDSYGSVEEA